MNFKKTNIKPDEIISFDLNERAIERYWNNTFIELPKYTIGIDFYTNSPKKIILCFIYIYVSKQGKEKEHIVSEEINKDDSSRRKYEFQAKFDNKQLLKIKFKILSRESKATLRYLF